MNLIQRMSITVLAVVELSSILLVVNFYGFPIMETNTNLGVALIFLFVTNIRFRHYHRFHEMLVELIDSAITHEKRSEEK